MCVCGLPAVSQISLEMMKHPLLASPQRRSLSFPATWAAVAVLSPAFLGCLRRRHTGRDANISVYNLYNLFYKWGPLIDDGSN